MAQHTDGTSGNILAYAAAVAAAALALVFAGLLPQVTGGETILFGWSWAPSLGIAVAFMVDGLALVFALLITGIGALIFLFTAGYMGGHPRFARFVTILFAFMLSMLGLVLARDLVTLFLFWEATSVTSYFLISFETTDPRARRNALQALFVTAAGGLCLLGAVVLIGMAGGTYDLARLLAGDGLQGHALYGPILILVLFAAFTKSAQLPFHFWLPNAMSAPTPVSAYLHSATMVKAGLYLLARFHPMLGGTDAWAWTLAIAGLATALTASVLALAQSDLKQSLAYTTLMALGTVTLLLSADAPYALTAAIVFVVAHALYKAALFMVAGCIEHAAGTRDVARLEGLWRVLPMTAFAAMLAGASMAGLPPLLGWIGKELVYAGGTGMAFAPAILPGTLVANALMVAVAVVVALRPFTGTRPADLSVKRKAPWQMLAGPLVLAVAGLFLGLSAQTLLGPLVDATLTGTLRQENAAALHLWPGFGLPLAMSLATFALGLMFLALRDRLRTIVSRPDLPDFDRGWDRFLDGFRALASWQTRRIQNGSLTFYLATSFTVAAVAVGGALLLGTPGFRFDPIAPVQVWMIVAVGAAGALAATVTHSRIAAIAGVGTVGLSVALLFIWFGAPDVATTQLMVETLAAVLFAVAALRLPAIAERRSRPRRLVHGVVAASLGLSMTMLVLAITAELFDRRLTDWFEEASYPLAHGLNIVNVILVDFRALDTFGELIVVLLAAIGAYAVLKRPTRTGSRT